ncbi:hypothetical protein B1R94_02185 [Mycolicibacterium litorale]|nr:hypothetical protein B1R94_02185 [Mycolicibacterium litorale]
MIGCRCDRCGTTVRTHEDHVDPGHRFTFTDVVGHEHDFCSVPCLIAYTVEYGCYKPPADGVVDAEIHCGSVSPQSGSDCKFTVDHPGTHVSHRGEEWADRTARGESHGRAKLTEADVRAIRAAARDGETYRSIAGRFGINRFTVGTIVRREKWSHVA